VLAARNTAALEAVAAQCTAQGAQALVVATDVSVEAQCRALIDVAVARFGRIDVLVNNAGHVGSRRCCPTCRRSDLGWYITDCP